MQFLPRDATVAQYVLLSCVCLALKLSERRATNIGLPYMKAGNNIGGDIPVDVPPTKILGDVSPASPTGLTPVTATALRFCSLLFFVFFCYVQTAVY